MSPSNVCDLIILRDLRFGIEVSLQDAESGRRIPLEPSLLEQLLTTEENTPSDEILGACPLHSYMQVP